MIPQKSWSLGNAKKCNTLKELLKISDVISIHVDGRKENVNLVGEKEFGLMKPGVIFLNLSRGLWLMLTRSQDKLNRAK